ncbi:MAG: M28 family metallopeptidase [Balneolaceae bacterium]|nr:M28 family metallopeptidase [Balneolaceae bacterium]
MLRCPQLLLAIILPVFTASASAQQGIDIEKHRTYANRLIDAALNDQASFRELTNFVDTFPHRLSGSPMLEESIDWILNEMEKGKLENVHTQEVMVPHWVRGSEHATLVSPYKKNLEMLGLGGSISTPKKGLEAEVLVVSSFEDLKRNAEKAKGKIVVYNVPFTTYGETVQYRLSGAVEAAKVGAVASLIRSVGPFSMNTPHTGISRYQEGVRKIPHAAITVEDAALLHRLQERGKKIRINLYMEARTLPDKPSRNIIAEIRGSRYPDEIIVLGGHIDAWDVGQGAMDDAGGCFAAWEALNIMKELGLRPKRTIRLVLWTNEENGLRGATTYRDIVVNNGSIDRHVLAMESDSGVFTPYGFGFTGSDEAYNMISQIGRLLEPIGANEITRGGGGADIGPLMKEGVPGMGLRVDGSRYFWYHHSPADTIDKLTAEDYKKCVATLAVMAYTAANLETTLPR